MFQQCSFTRTAHCFQNENIAPFSPSSIQHGNFCFTPKQMAVGMGKFGDLDFIGRRRFCGFPYSFNIRLLYGLRLWEYILLDESQQRFVKLVAFVCQLADADMIFRQWNCYFMWYVWLTAISINDKDFYWLKEFHTDLHWFSLSKSAHRNTSILRIEIGKELLIE